MHRDFLILCVHLYISSMPHRCLRQGVWNKKHRKMCRSEYQFHFLYWLCNLKIFNLLNVILLPGKRGTKLFSFESCLLGLNMIVFWYFLVLKRDFPNSYYFIVICCLLFDELMVGGHIAEERTWRSGTEALKSCYWDQTHPPALTDCDLGGLTWPL